MPAYEPLSATRHSGKRWQPNADYGFARSQSVVAVTAAEMMRAAAALPIAFQLRKDTLLPVALLGIEPDCNLMVSATGKWLGGYLPAVLRAYPFLLKSLEDGKQVLCIDESAASLNDGPDGRPLLTEDGKPSAAVEEVLRFLSLTWKSRQLAIQACAALRQHALLKPWPIKVATANGDKAIEGFFQIDEEALAALGGEALAALRDAGALAVAYCQLISMQHIGLLGQLANSQRTSPAREAADEVSILDTLSQGGTLKLHGF